MNDTQAEALVKIVEKRADLATRLWKAIVESTHEESPAPTPSVGVFYGRSETVETSVPPQAERFDTTDG